MTKRIKPWRLLRSTPILDHAQLQVNEDEIELPDGQKTTYVRHAPTDVHAVIMIAINKKDQILVQKEYSHPPEQIMWQLPGGSLHVNEKIEAGAIRELAEESGYSAKNTTVVGSYFVHNRLSDKKQYVVLCTGLFKHKLNEDSDEFIETFWLSEQKLRENIANGTYENINLLAALNIWFNSRIRETNV